MTVKNIWTSTSAPGMLIIEEITGVLTQTAADPYRVLRDSDLQVYRGQHPRRISGVPLPQALFSLYGVEKGGEAATEVIHIRVTCEQKKEVNSKAASAGLSPTDYLRQIIFGQN